MMPSFPLASLSSLFHVLLLPTMRPLLVVLACPVVCLVFCATTDLLIHFVDRLSARRGVCGNRLVELKPMPFDRTNHARVR